MKKLNALSILAAGILAAGLFPTGAQAEHLVACDAFTGVTVHWDKIIFTLGDDLARETGQRGREPLDIKVLDDPHEVADLKAKVLRAIGAQINLGNRDQVTINDVEYAIACVSVEPAIVE